MKKACHLKYPVLFTLALTLAVLPPRPANASVQEEAVRVPLYELGADVKNSKRLSIGQTDAWEIFLSPEVLAASAKAHSFEMPLAGGEKIVLHKTSAARLDEGSFVWRGFIDGPLEQLGEATLTLKNHVMSDRIQTHDRLLMIVPGAAGSHHLVELDESLFPECGDIESSPDPGWPSATPTASGSEPSRAVNGVITIDVMSLYTPQARDGAGGVAAIEATIQNAVDVTNTAFQNSGSSARLNLVHTSLVEYDESESEDAEEDLRWFDSDPAVAALRDLHYADMVSLIVEDAGEGLGGVAWPMNEVGPDFERWAFQVTRRDSAISILAFAHEHGHNHRLRGTLGRRLLRQYLRHQSRK